MKLGPIVREDGLEFRLLAPEATRAELCVFLSSRDAAPYARVAAARSHDGIWRAFAPGCGVDCLYAWSVDGPRDLPLSRFDPGRLLLDPAGWQVEPVADGQCARAMSRVVDPAFDWRGVESPRIDPRRRVVYEAHVKGFTRLHPGVPAALRGTFAGLATDVVIDHLRSLGVTTLELLPVHAHLDDAFLLERGLVNYWGYSTLSWFAPHPSLAWQPHRAVDEFREMVRSLHGAGIEVVLDVVYNHSCEGGPGDSVHGLRGLGAWYRADPTDPSRHQDFTGCGNSLDFRKEHVRRLVLASLRHWVELGVDGFRFDLASVHGRMDEGFDPQAPFFYELASDPVLSTKWMVAEPWDATTEGYALGKYPDPWAEWNDRFRDDVRLFWKGEGNPRLFALRMAGSPDIYPDRGPLASINYVACHDGFSARDLATYARKHNDANGESNRDGSDWNHSDNLGHEGECPDPRVVAARVRRVRNLLASALLARGVPMLLAGDEMGRTQGGNNNAYCQDNETSWIDWCTDGPWPNPTWVGEVLRLRSRLPTGGGSWGWIEEPAEDGPLAALHFPSLSGDWALVANPSAKTASVRLPAGTWRMLLDTSTSVVGGPSQVHGALEVQADSLVVLERV